MSDQAVAREPREYKHWPWCNGSRHHPAGDPGHSCSCFNAKMAEMSLGAATDEIPSPNPVAEPSDELRERARERFEQMQSKGWLLPEEWKAGAIHFAVQNGAHELQAARERIAETEDVLRRSNAEIERLKLQLESANACVDRAEARIRDWRDDSGT